MINCSTSFILCFALTTTFVSPKLCWKLSIETLSAKNCDWGNGCDLRFQVKTDQLWQKVELNANKGWYTSSDHRLQVSHVDDHGDLPQRLSITFYDENVLLSSTDTRLCTIGQFEINSQKFSKSSSCRSKPTLSDALFDPTVVNVSFKGEVRDCSGSILNLSNEHLIVVLSVSAIVILLSVLCCLGIRLRKYYKKQTVLIDKPKEVVPPVTESLHIFIPEIISRSQSRKRMGSISERNDKRSVIPNPALTPSVSLHPKISIRNKSTFGEWKETSKTTSQTEQRSSIRPNIMTKR